MKKKDIKSLREKDVKELEKKVVELRKKVFTLAPRISAGAEKNSSALKVVKRDIAQILSIIAELDSGKAQRKEK